MAKCQCPNCGGYKTYQWKTNWRSDLLQAGGLGGAFCFFLVFVGGPLAAAIPLAIVTLFILLKLHEYATGPAKAYVCQICDFNFNAGETASAANVKPNLIEMGNALLERQRAAAEAAAEEERHQQEQRRWYAGA